MRGKIETLIFERKANGWVGTYVRAVARFMIRKSVIPIRE